MSNTLTEPILSFEPPHTPEAALRRKSLVRIWAKRLVLLVLAIWFVDAGISVLIQHTVLKRRLTARLSAVFGRDVEVGQYSFSAWSGPTFRAQSVVVAEDPRFGHEYFLRAESLTVRVAWRSLMTGHLELGTIFLSRPSMNLVRNSDGDWNLAEWLPRSPSSSGSEGLTSKASIPASSLRFRRIDVDDGRVNFKRGDDKLPFAFSSINGTLATERSGRWQLDLTATPLRAAVVVQEPGIIHLVGDVGGTSSRLRPAALQLTWSGATVPDALRLLQGRDYGVRGDLDLAISARTEGDVWLMETNAALSQLHRWDLPLRADDPSANIMMKGKIDSGGTRLFLTDARIDAPHSSARIVGAIDWSESNGQSVQTTLRIVSAGVGASDLLAWARAFHPAIDEGVSFNGFGHADLSLAGWPPRVNEGTFDLPRLEMQSPRLRGPVRASPVEIRYGAKTIDLAPVTVTIGPSGGSFRVDGSSKSELSDFDFHIQGGASQAREIITAASELGWNLSRSWDIAGSVRCDLHWQGLRAPLRSEWAGTIEWGSPTTGVSLRTQFLNLPVDQIRARAELKPAATHVTLSSAEAFGARWTGTFDHDLTDGWRFNVSADQLSTVDLDRWLNPLWRESFLDRILPFLNSRSERAAVTPENVRAQGRLAIDEFRVGTLPLRRLRGELSMDGRHLQLSNATAQFEKGDISGSLAADLVSSPRYQAALDFSGVDVSSLSAHFPSLANIFAGSASAKIGISMQGNNRSDLLSSVECRGSAHIVEPSIAGVDFAQTARESGPDEVQPASARLSAQGARDPFRDASASFSCAEGKIHFQDLVLRGSPSTWDAAGTVDYSRNLDFEVRELLAGSRLADSVDSETREYHIGGSLSSPRITSKTPSPPPGKAGNP